MERQEGVGKQNETQTRRIPWLEKYRPKILDDVVGNVLIMDRLRTIAKEGNMPNMILSGPPGCGKTTSMLCLARTMLKKSFGDAVLELNASDDRGINVVRETISRFIDKRLTLPPKTHKIVILDEADRMTSGAQQSLKRVMEKCSNTTRFVLACNDSTEIIEALQSRCTILRFVYLSPEHVKKRLLEIMTAENIFGHQWDEGGMNALLFTADGDMRQAIANLQSTFNAYGMISEENVFRICDQPHPVILQQCLALCYCRDMYGASQIITKQLEEGYACIDILKTLFRVAKSSSSFESAVSLKVEGGEKEADADEKEEGANEDEENADRGEEENTTEKRIEFIREIGFCQLYCLESCLDAPLQLYGLIARLCLL